MLTEDYCDFETAKLLKEKGFDEAIDLWYDENGDKFFAHHCNIRQDWRVRQNQKVYQCPTIQMACKWLREKYNILIVVDRGVSFYTWQLENNTTGEYIEDFIGEVPTYEGAVEAACLYVLKNLI